MIESSKAREYLYFKSKLEEAEKLNDEKEVNFLLDRLDNLWNEMSNEEQKQLKK